jgi:hypothetical protein
MGDAVKCTGKYKGGLTPTVNELKEILKQHAAWVKDDGPNHLNDPKVADDPRRANLCEAHLRGVDLRGAHLGGADLGRANLVLADLSGAHLNDATLILADLAGADLERANLHGADLEGMLLERANLQGADLSHTNLETALLGYANLQGANLQGADLSHTDLSYTDLDGVQVSKTKLAYTTLTNAIYAPASEPPDPYVVGIKGLATIKAAPGEEIGLIQLRKLLQDAGLRDAVREATYSIQNNITRDLLAKPPSLSLPPSLQHRATGLLSGLTELWAELKSDWTELKTELQSETIRLPSQINGILRTVGLEWTTAYGLYPERALRGILLLGAIVMPVYMFAMLWPTAESGIIRVFPADRLDGTKGDPADEEKVRKQLVHARRWREALRTAAYFSLISAVNIGFEQFTPGDWIRRLQTREYSLEAVGWVRVVAGVQALLSVYLLAMWVLTQFGQPFE